MIDRTIDEQLAGRRTGEVSVFTCPECGGSLWESDGETDLRFRCHVGHAYSAQAMESHQHGRVEAALWTAVRALEERASLLRRIGASLERRGLGGAVVADRRREADDVESHAHVLRGLLTGARVRAGADRATADEEADAG